MATKARQSAAQRIRDAVKKARVADRKAHPQTRTGAPKKKYKKTPLGAGGANLTPTEKKKARKIIEEMGQPTGSK